MIVAVGTARGPKIEGVKRALAALAVEDAQWSRAELVCEDVGSGVASTPLHLEELLHGARSRAERVHALVTSRRGRVDVSLGLEGGVDMARDRDRGFLMSWAYATDGVRGAFGCGGAVELPPTIVDGLAAGAELAHLMETHSGVEDVRSRQGAWGVLTRGLLDRARSFEIAVLNALAPFYNQESYR